MKKMQGRHVENRIQIDGMNDQNGAEMASS
jgi:hypothetical protein